MISIFFTYNGFLLIQNTITIFMITALLYFVVITCVFKTNDNSIWVQTVCQLTCLFTTMSLALVLSKNVWIKRHWFIDKSEYVEHNDGWSTHAPNSNCVHTFIQIHTVYILCVRFDGVKGVNAHCCCSCCKCLKWCAAQVVLPTRMT